MTSKSGQYKYLFIITLHFECNNIAYFFIRDYLDEFGFKSSKFFLNTCIISFDYSALA